jgi:hypothetical protein
MSILTSSNQVHWFSWTLLLIGHSVTYLMSLHIVTTFYDLHSQFRGGFTRTWTKSGRLGLRLPRGPQIVLWTYTFYHSPVVLLNAVLPKPGGKNPNGRKTESDERKNYGNASKLNYQLTKFCIFTYVIQSIKSNSVSSNYTLQMS